MAGAEMNPFLVEVLSRPGGETVLQCYQCGTCSGSCPVIDEMEYGPRRLMHLIASGEEEAVLSCADMWFCVSCYSCANRCPRDIAITDLMGVLRELSLEKGYAADKEADFGLAFANTYKRHGRLFEPELMMRYYARTLDVLSLLGMMPLALQMLARDKLPFWPERIRNPQEMQKIAHIAHGPQDDRLALTTHQKRLLPWLFSGAMTLAGFLFGFLVLSKLVEGGKE